MSKVCFTEGLGKFVRVQYVTETETGNRYAEAITIAGRLHIRWRSAEDGSRYLYSTLYLFGKYYELIG